MKLVIKTNKKSFKLKISIFEVLTIFYLIQSFLTYNYHYPKYTQLPPKILQQHSYY
jgi:hypothetical protein